MSSCLVTSVRGFTFADLWSLCLADPAVEISRVAAEQLGVDCGQDSAPMSSVLCMASPDFRAAYDLGCDEWLSDLTASYDDDAVQLAYDAGRASMLCGGAR